MTFKHAKFEDSVVMRSLEKLAQEKGLVNPEETIKSAAAQVDLLPTSNLMENILNLCAGLRQFGFNKHADELEEKFMSYKQAQTLYETTSEKGEDLVDRAHPKGSHHLEDVEGNEAVFETIIDQHLKHLEMINKKPTGKLADAHSIINAVKMVFADEDQNAKLQALMQEVRQTASEIVNLTESELTVSWSNPANVLNKLSESPTIDNLKKMQEVVNRQKGRLKPGIAFGVSEDTWEQVSPKLNRLTDLISKAISTRYAILNPENKSAPAEKPSTDGRAGDSVAMSAEGKQFLSQVNTYLAQLNSFQVAVENDPDNSPADKAQARAWITKKITALNGLKQQFVNEQDPASQNSKAPGFLSALNKNVKDFAQFKNEWIG